MKIKKNTQVVCSPKIQGKSNAFESSLQMSEEKCFKEFIAKLLLFLADSYCILYENKIDFAIL